MGKEDIADSIDERLIAVSDKDKYRKSNFLISSVYKSSLTENRVLAVMLNHIDDSYEDKGGNIVCTIKASELKKILNVKGNGVYDRLSEVAKRMAGGRAIGYSDPEKQTFAYAPLIVLCAMQDGEFTCKFNGAMRKYLKSMKNQYTELNLSTMLSLSSVYAFRLYELLRSACYYPKGVNVFENDVFKVEMNLSELKLEMGVVNGELERTKAILSKTGENGTPDYDRAVERSEEKMYDKYSKFRERCLEPAVNEISEKTEMQVKFEPMRTGRGGKTTGIRFYVRMNRTETEYTETHYDNEDDLIDAIREKIDVSIKTSEARAIADAANGNVNIIAAAAEYTRKQNPDNFVAYLIDTIKNGYYKDGRVVQGKVISAEKKTFANPKPLDAEEIIKKMK